MPAYITVPCHASHIPFIIVCSTYMSPSILYSYIPSSYIISAAFPLRYVSSIILLPGLYSSCIPLTPFSACIHLDFYPLPLFVSSPPSFLFPSTVQHASNSATVILLSSHYSAHPSLVSSSMHKRIQHTLAPSFLYCLPLVLSFPSAILDP